MANDFNIPREQQTFLGMMDNFFANLARSIDTERENIKKETEAYRAKEEQTEKKEKSTEVHVHVHAANKGKNELQSQKRKNKKGES